MSGFNENSQMPERTQGHVEYLPDQRPEENAEPSVEATNRYQLPQFITRYYHPEISSAGNPYLVPHANVLKDAVANAEDLLQYARNQYKLLVDDERIELLEASADAEATAFDRALALAGDDREWVARKRKIWPLTDELGAALFRAYVQREELASFAAYLVVNDGNIDSFEKAKTDERYIKREFWFSLSIREVAEVDVLVQRMEDTEYAFDPIVRRGGQSVAMGETRKHLSGGQGNEPITRDTEDVTAKMREALMAS